MTTAVAPDEMLQRMKAVLHCGSNHTYYYWALGILDAFLLYPPKEWKKKSVQNLYNKGYKERSNFILEEEEE